MKHYLPNGSYVETLRTTMGIKEMDFPVVDGEWKVVDEEIATTTNNTQKVSVDGVKIPVLSMEDVPKLAKEMEK